MRFATIFAAAPFVLKPVAVVLPGLAGSKYCRAAVIYLIRSCAVVYSWCWDSVVITRRRRQKSGPGSAFKAKRVVNTTSSPFRYCGRDLTLLVIPSNVSF